MESLISKNKKLSPVLKISLSALFIVLATILQKILAINYIPIIPFLRISLGGPAIIIFSSIFLGPFYGLFIGAASDFLGYFLLDPKLMAFFPQITLIYAVLGFVSYFIFKGVKAIKNRPICIICESSILLIVILIISIFLWTNKTINLYGNSTDINLFMRIFIPLAMLILTIGLVIFIIVFDLKFNKKNKSNIFNPAQISFALLFIEILVMILFGSFMKGWAFGFATYPAILICQIIVAYINVVFNTAVISILIRIITKKYN